MNMEKRRNTVQRQIILDAIKALGLHVSAEQIYGYVAQKHPNVSKATIYRNLNQMAESCELMNIGDFNNSIHYDYNCHEHYHLLCKDCKQIFDVYGDYSDIINKHVKTDGFDIIDYRLTFSGLCWDCKAKRGE